MKAFHGTMLRAGLALASMGTAGVLRAEGSTEVQFQNFFDEDIQIVFDKNAPLDPTFEFLTIRDNRSKAQYHRGHHFPEGGRDLRATLPARRCGVFSFDFQRFPNYLNNATYIVYFTAIAPRSNLSQEYAYIANRKISVLNNNTYFSADILAHGSRHPVYQCPPEGPAETKGGSAWNVRWLGRREDRTMFLPDPYAVMALEAKYKALRRSRPATAGPAAGAGAGAASRVPLDRMPERKR